jgi:phosphatidylglycerol:prolipoprotein diacylglycerol transferase
VYARRANLPGWQVLDAAAPAMLVGQIIGRFGCLANGDAWGAPTDWPWGVVYSHVHAALPSHLIGVPTHPYPAYEMVALALLLVILPRGSEHSPHPGRLFLLTVLGYSAVRFVLTFVRQEPILLMGLQEAQVVAVITAVMALGGLLMLRRGMAVPARIL